MAGLPNRDQDGVQHARRLSLMQKRHDLLDGREWRVMERNVPTMPRGGIFRNGVFLRYGATRQPSPKIGLDFLTLGMQANSAVPRHSIKTTHKTSGDNSLR
jgi:hypothetical protein